MKMNEMYGQVTKEKKNQVKGPKMAPEMTEKEFVKEHKNLIKVLKSGSRSELDAEAKLQQEELDECLGKKEEVGEPVDAEDTNE